MNYERFYDTSPNGDAIMNVGACLPKKRMEDFLRLGSLVPGRSLNLYAMGYMSDQIVDLNRCMGNPVNIVPPVEPSEMLKEYKKHSWLVYTADPDINTVGWPMSVAEAQAAGVGVCFPNLRPDLAEYLGGAGYLYDSIAEVAQVVASPPPDGMREKGFEQARKSDIRRHRSILTDLWETFHERSAQIQGFRRRPNDEVMGWGKGASQFERTWVLREKQLQEINKTIRYSLAKRGDGLEESIVSKSGETIRIVPHTMDGAVDAVTQQREHTRVSGWASDGAHRGPANQVAVFVNGEAGPHAHTVVHRPDLVEGFKTKSLLKAGFEVILPGLVFERDSSPPVRVFAISATGVASELQYLPEYADGRRTLKLGNH